MPIKLDQATSTVLYVGVTPIKNSTADSVWKILRLTDIGDDTDIEEPTDVRIGGAIWDNRTSYTYG